MIDLKDNVDAIISDLTNVDKKLGVVLLRTTILAHQLNSEALKKWIELELEGYNDDEIPNYRKLVGKLYVDATDYKDKRHFFPSSLANQSEQTLSIREKVSSFEERIEGVKQGNYVLILHIPLIMHRALFLPEFIKDYNHVINDVGYYVSSSSIKATVASIKYNLLNFLMEIRKEIDKNSVISLVDKQEKVDTILETTILKGVTMNIFTGTNPTQTNIDGDGNQAHTGSGSNTQ
jgi:hypothetical protein